MIKNEHIFALLVGVGDYRKLGMQGLATYKMDLLLMGSALTDGLKVPRENIRLMAGEEHCGKVYALEFAKAISEFRSMLNENDIFILYFSGHGEFEKLLFSDASISIKSILEFLETLTAKSKILILDCCYSGAFGRMGAKKLSLSESIEKFQGHGTAVMASSAQDEVSRLGPGNNHSMFTGAVSSVIAVKRKVRKGRTSLSDIFDGTRELVDIWNKKNPGKEQHVIFRKNMGGTIFFDVEEYEEYKPKTVTYIEDDYNIIEVKPLSTLSIKRLCAFVKIKPYVIIDKLPAITNEIVERVKNEEVYSTAASEALFRGSPARAIWCYFGYDDEDMVNHLYIAHTVWADTSELQNIYYETGKNTSVIQGINVNINTSYDLVKRITTSTQTRDVYVKENKKLLAEIVSMAEQFVADLEEVANGTISNAELQEKYRPWANRVRNTYIHLSEMDVAPVDLHDWSEEISSLAGWILDMALVIDQGERDFTGREKWLLKDAVRKYNQSMERVAQLETEIKAW